MVISHIIEETLKSLQNVFAGSACGLVNRLTEKVQLFADCLDRLPAKRLLQRL